MQKGVSVLVSTVLVVLISVVAIGAVLLIGLPLINQFREAAVVDEAQSNMKVLDDLISQAASEGAGIVKTAQIKVSGGSYKVNPESETFDYNLQLQSGFLQKGTFLRQGNILTSVSGVATASQNSTNIVLENEVLQIVFSRVGNKTSFDGINTSSLVKTMTLKPTNTVITPNDTSIIIAGISNTSWGLGYSELSVEGTNLARAEVKEHVRSNTTGVEYDVLYTLPASSDFMIVSVKNVTGNKTTMNYAYKLGSNDSDVLRIGNINETTFSVGSTSTSTFASNQKLNLANTNSSQNSSALSILLGSVNILQYNASDGSLRNVSELADIGQGNWSFSTTSSSTTLNYTLAGADGYEFGVRDSLPGGSYWLNNDSSLYGRINISNDFITVGLAENNFTIYNSSQKIIFNASFDNAVKLDGNNLLSTYGSGTQNKTLYFFDWSNQSWKVWTKGVQNATNGFPNWLDPRNKQEFKWRYAFQKPGQPSVNITYMMTDSDPFVRTFVDGNGMDTSLVGTSNARAWWPLDDGAGSSSNDIVSGLKMTLYNGTVWSDGKFGSALSFNGKGSYANMTNSSSLSTSQATIEFWVNPATLSPVAQVIASSRDVDIGTQTYNWEAYVNSTGYVNFVLGRAGWLWDGCGLSTTPLTTNNWYHVAFTFDSSGNRRGYINGVPQTLSSITGPLLCTASAVNMRSAPYLVLGAEPETSYFGSPRYFFNGTIDGLKIFNRTLTADEIQSEYSGRQNITIPISLPENRTSVTTAEPGLVGYWNFNEGGGGKVTDSSGNGNTGTTNSGDAWISNPSCVYNGCMAIDGSTGQINVPDSASLRLTNGITISAWIKLNTAGATGYHTVAIKGSAESNENYYFGVRGVGSGSDRLIMTGSTYSGSREVIIPEGWSADTWYHITGTITSGGVVSVYLNGVLRGVSAGDTLTSNSLPLQIGYVNDPPGWTTNYFNGKIDDLRIYNRVLNESEVQQLYRTGINQDKPAIYFTKNNATENEEVLFATDNARNVFHYANTTPSYFNIFSNQTNFFGFNYTFNSTVNQNFMFTLGTMGRMNTTAFNPQTNTSQFSGETPESIANSTMTYYDLSGFVATGGTVTYSGGYKIHTFTSNGTFNVTGGSGPVEILVVAGGGGGGGSCSNGGGGGGGAGGIAYASGYTVANGVYTVTVGSGGAGGSSGVYPACAGSIAGSGGNSVFGAIVANGGGGGGGYAPNGTTYSGSNGGSGGGAPGDGSSYGSTTQLNGNGTIGYGNNGGSGGNGAGGHQGPGGGGGAGAVGSNGDTTTGAGGAGKQFSISGSANNYGGGGGGGGWVSAGGASGGSGGGGAGGNGNGVNGTSGTANTGGGGGGGGYNYPLSSPDYGGNGGSGIVIVRYPYPYTQSNLTAQWNVSGIGGGAQHTVSPAFYYDGGAAGVWHFDEGTGLNATDASGNGNVGTLTNSPTWISNSSCKVAGCVYFSGGSDYIDLGKPDSLNMAGPMTFEAWVYPTGSGSHIGGNFNAAGTTAQWNLLWANAGGTTALRWQQCNSNTCVQFSGTTALATWNRWNHIAVVRDSATGMIKFYVNGVQDATTATSTSATIGPYASSGTNALGAAGTYNSFKFSGYMDEPRLYARALSASEIREQYQQGASKYYDDFGTAANGKTYEYYGVEDSNTSLQPIDPPGTILHLRFNDNSTSNVTDSSGNGNNGYVVGPSGWVTNSSCKQNFGGCIIMNGANNYVVSADKPFEFESTDKFSIAYWMKSNQTVAPATAMRLVVKADVPFGIRGWLQQIHGDYGPGVHMFMGTGQATGVGVGSNKNELDGNWHFITSTYDGSRSASGLKMYADGVDVSFITHNGDIVTGSMINTQNLTIGADSGSGNDKFNGTIDEVMVVNRTLTPDEVYNLYLGGAQRHGGDLVGWWKFNDNATAGNVTLDSSGNGNTGTLTQDGGGSMTIWVANSSCKLNGCLFFPRGSSSVGSHVDVSDNPSLNFGRSQDFTLEAWVRPNGTASDDFTILDKGRASSGFGSFRFRVSSGGVAALDITDLSTSVSLTGQRNVSDGNMHNVVAVFKRNGNATIFVDGVSDSTVNISSIGSISNADSLQIGAGKDSIGTIQTHFSGYIDNVKIWKRALTADEVMHEYLQTQDQESIYGRMHRVASADDVQSVSYNLTAKNDTFETKDYDRRILFVNGTASTTTVLPNSPTPACYTPSNITQYYLCSYDQSEFSPSKTSGIIFSGSGTNFVSACVDQTINQTGAPYKFNLTAFGPQTSILPITNGVCTDIGNKTDIINSNGIPTTPFSSFSLQGPTNLLMSLQYSKIKVAGDANFALGSYKVCVTKVGQDGQRVVVNVTTC